jgi:hypothetical protein
MAMQKLSKVMINSLAIPCLRAGMPYCGMQACVLRHKIIIT